MQTSSLVSRISRTFAAASSIAVAVVTPFAAHAGTALQNIREGMDTTAEKAGVGGSGSKSLAELTGSFISAGLALLGIILVVIIIYAGFLWMTAQGNDEKVKTAKKMITNAVIGMVLIFAAYAITSFVVGAIETATQGA